MNQLLYRLYILETLVQNITITPPLPPASKRWRCKEC